jgi:single-stranded DNA-binding protein
MATTGKTTPTPEKERRRVLLAGRIGQNPTLRTTPQGTLAPRFPLGVRMVHLASQMARSLTA